MVGRPEKPVDPPEGPVAEFALQLRARRRDAGLTYWQMTRRAHYSVPALSLAASGRQRPSWEVTKAYLLACNTPHDQIDGAWRKRWERLAGAADGEEQLDGVAGHRDDRHDSLPASPTPPGPQPRSPLAQTDGLGFGSNLRRLREASGFSLADLAVRIRFDKGYISKIENGLRCPSDQFVQACDTTLGAEGRLLAAHADTPQRHKRARPNREQERAAPELYALAESVTPQLVAQLDLLRLVGQRVPAGMLFPVAAQYAGLLRDLAGRNTQSGPTLALAARFAEYAGQLAREAGDSDGAYRWATGAARLAARASELGDPTAEHVDVGVSQWGDPGDVLIRDLLPGGAQGCDDGIEDQDRARREGSVPGVNVTRPDSVSPPDRSQGDQERARPGPSCSPALLRRPAGESLGAAVAELGNVGVQRRPAHPEQPGDRGDRGVRLA